MKNSKLLVLGMLLMSLFFVGYQCSSTELTSAKLYYDQKNWEKAIEMLQAEVQKNPKSDEGYYYLGMVYIKLDSVDQMVESFDKSLSISNKFAQEIENEKYTLWRESMNKGLAYYNRSLNATDDSVKILLEKAVPSFETAIKAEPDSGLGYQFLAVSHLRKLEYEKAIEPLKKLIELDTAEVGYQYLGELYKWKAENKMSDFKNSKNPEDSIEAMGFYNQTIVTLEEGLKKYPENSDMQVSRTSAYIGAGRIAEAIEASKILVDNEPNDKIYRYNYGVLLLNAERYSEAETQLLEALKIDPEYENAIYNLGVTYVKWGTAMNKEAEQKGTISEDYKKKYEAALPYLEKVVETDATNVAIWELLGKVYSVLGMTDDANNAFKKADELR